MSFLKEFLEFIKVRKKYWLLPIFIVLVLFGGLIILNPSKEGAAPAGIADPVPFALYGRPSAKLAAWSCSIFITSSNQSSAWH